MANGVTALRKIQLGKESGGAAGAAVAATTIWRGMGLLDDERDPKHVEESIGVAQPTTRAYIPKLGCKVVFNPVEATFQQLPYLFEAGVAIESPTNDGTGYVYAYAVNTTSIQTIETYTIEMGDNQLVQETDYGFVEKIKISGNAGEGLMMSAEWRGRDVVDSSFTGALSVPTLLPGHHIVFGGSTLAIDAVGGTIGSTAVSSTLLSFELDFTTGWRAKWTNAGKDFDFVYFDKDTYAATLKLVYEHNAAADAQRDLYEAATPRLLRLQFPGPALGTPGSTYTTYLFRIDCAGVYTGFKRGEKDGNSIIEAEMKLGYDLTASSGLSFLVVNESSALP